MQILDRGKAEKLHHAIPVTLSPMAGHAGNVEPLLSALHQFHRHRNRDGRHGVCALGKAGVDRVIFLKRVNLLASTQHDGLAARHRALHQRLRAHAVLEEVIGLQRAQLRLAIHVRKNFQGRLAGHVPAETGQAHDQEHHHGYADQDVPHSASSTISMWFAPVLFSSTRVS